MAVEAVAVGLDVFVVTAVTWCDGGGKLEGPTSNVIRAAWGWLQVEPQGNQGDEMPRILRRPSPDQGPLSPLGLSLVLASSLLLRWPAFCLLLVPGPSAGPLPYLDSRFCAQPEAPAWGGLEGSAGMETGLKGCPGAQTTQ